MEKRVIKSYDCKVSSSDFIRHHDGDGVVCYTFDRDKFLFSYTKRVQKSVIVGGEEYFRYYNEDVVEPICGPDAMYEIEICEINFKCKIFIPHKIAEYIISWNGDCGSQSEKVKLHGMAFSFGFLPECVVDYYMDKWDSWDDRPGWSLDELDPNRKYKKRPHEFPFAAVKYGSGLAIVFETTIEHFLSMKHQPGSPQHNLKNELNRLGIKTESDIIEYRESLYRKREQEEASDIYCYNEESVSCETKKTYLIKNKRNGLYKIGKSKNPKIREYTLQSEEPTIEMVKVWDDDIEAELHCQYRKQRVRGEWFELTPIQVRYIATHY